MKKLLLISTDSRRRQEAVARLGDREIVQARTALEGLWRFGDEIDGVLFVRAGHVELVPLADT